MALGTLHLSYMFSYTVNMFLFPNFFLPLFPLAPVCGFAPLNSKPTDTDPGVATGRWPWMVSIQRNGVHECGGSLLTGEFVLSLADCFKR